MANVSNAQIAKNTAFIKKAQDELRKRQEEFRNDPAKLSAAIAEQIRTDDHPNEDPDSYVNGAMHWFQSQWSTVKLRLGAFNKLQAPVRRLTWEGTYAEDTQDHNWFEVSCPTTGCVAGWADSLAGFQLVFKKELSSFDREENPDASDEELVMDVYHNEGDLINVEKCYDSRVKKVRDISDVAADLLHLDPDQRDWLFDGYREKDEVLWALDKIADKEDWYPYGYDDEIRDEAEQLTFTRQ